jgi:hypothetical protein
MITEQRPGWMSPQLWEAWTFRAEGAQSSGQDPTAGTGQDPTQAPGQASGTTMTLEEAQAALAAARREAAANRTKLSALEKEKADQEAAKLSEQEKLAKRVKELEETNARIAAEAQTAATNARIEREAARLGAVDPELLTRLIDSASIERDAAGNPTNLEALIKGVLKAKPYLVAETGQSAPAAGATNPASGRGTPALTLADIKKMTPTQINARWKDVQEALARGV